MYATVLNQRLVAYTETACLRSQAQAAFRPGLSTEHQLFALQHFIDKHIKSRQPLFVCFVDLKAAYDRVRRPLLWTTLQHLRVGDGMLRAVRSLYDSPQLAVSVGGQCGASRQTTIGVKQGCPLSPTLFGLFLDGLDTYLRSAVPAARPQMRGGRRVESLSYADDITLMAVSDAELQRLIDATHAYCGLVGMQLSADKTKAMVFARQGSTQFAWTCNGQPLQEVLEFKYLGMLFSAQRGLPAAMARVKQIAAGASAILQERYQNLQCSSHIPLLVSLYRTAVPAAASVSFRGDILSKSAEKEAISTYWGGRRPPKCGDGLKYRPKAGASGWGRN